MPQEVRMTSVAVTSDSCCRKSSGQKRSMIYPARRLGFAPHRLFPFSSRLFLLVVLFPSIVQLAWVISLLFFPLSFRRVVHFVTAGQRITLYTLYLGTTTLTALLLVSFFAWTYQRAGPVLISLLGGHDTIRAWAYRLVRLDGKQRQICISRRGLLWQSCWALPP